MNTWVFSLCRNEVDLVPFYLRHYKAFAEKIIVFDDWSTDGTRELLQACPMVELHNWPFDTGIDEDKFLEFAISTYRMARGHAQWVMWVDMDEIIWGDDIPTILYNARRDGFDVVQTQGFNMVGEGLPADDGRQIWEILPMGVRAPVYSKPVVFNPDIEIRWNRGKHALENCAPKMTPEPWLKLLHYRYLGRAYTAKKNAKNYERVGLKSGDKGGAWSCAPDWKGEHSADWAEAIKGHEFNALKA